MEITRFLTDYIRFSSAILVVLFGIFLKFLVNLYVARLKILRLKKQGLVSGHLLQRHWQNYRRAD